MSRNGFGIQRRYPTGQRLHYGSSLYILQQMQYAMCADAGRRQLERVHRAAINGVSVGTAGQHTQHSCIKRCTQ